MIWGLGNFSGVSSGQLPVFVVSITAGLVLSVMLIKPLNALLLGNRYAENLGVNVRLTRNLLLIATGMLTAITTAFCGPIAFIGLAVPLDAGYFEPQFPDACDLIAGRGGSPVV